MTNNPDLNSILSIPPGVLILSSEDCPSQNRLTLDVDFLPEEHVCPRCGSHHCIANETGKPQNIRHLSSAERSVFIRFTPRRFVYEDCRAAFKESVSWVHPGLQMTDALFMEILLRLTENVSIRSIADQEHVTPCVVKDVLDLSAARKPEELPTVLCMFDFRAKVGTWDSDIHHWDTYAYLCGIADGATGELLDILPETDAACLSDYFGSYTVRQLGRIQAVICSMKGSFISAARKFFPSAAVGIESSYAPDRLNSAMDQIRMRHLGDPAIQDPSRLAENRLLLKGAARFLRIMPSGEFPVMPQDTSHQERLSRVLELFPDISEMYSILMEFSAVMADDSPDTVRRDFNECLKRASSSAVPEIRDAASTLRRWRGYILNGLRFSDYGTCCMEIMEAIRAFMHISGDTRSFEDLRNRLLLICGPVHPASPSDSPAGTFRPPCGGED